MTQVRTSTAEVAGPASRLAVVQGLRGVAVLLVLVFHAGLPLPGGFAGVDVFFVISGYVICRLLLTETASRGRISFSRFYRRRVRRLLPAFAVLLCFVLVGSMVIESPIETQGQTATIAGAGAVWLANLALLVITGDYFAAGVKPSLLHTWSLAVEEQFYVIFPAIIALTCWLFGRRRRAARAAGASGESGRRVVPVRALIAVIAACSLLSLLIDLWLSYAAPAGVPRPLGVSFFLPMSRAWEFGAGTLVALALHRGWSPSRTAGNAVAVSGTLLLVFSAFWLTEQMAFPGAVALLPVVGTALMILGTVTVDGPVQRALAWPPLVRVGDLSYSLYLWHWPLVVFAGTLFGVHLWISCLAVLLSVPAAYASYRWVEQPFRERRGLVRRTPLLLVPCLGLPLALSVVLTVGANAYWGNDRVRDVAEQVTPRALGWDTCMSGVPYTERDLEACTFGGSKPAEKVILMGDSNGGQYADGLVAAGRATDTTVILANAPGCSLNPVEPFFARGRDLGCRALAEDGIAWAKTQAPATIIIGDSNVVVDSDAFGLVDPDSGERTLDRAKKAEIWRAGLDRTYAELRGAGLRVVQVTAMPHFVDEEVWRPATCSFIALGTTLGDCGETMSLADGNRDHALGLAAETRAAADNGVEVLDLRGVICPEATCSTSWGDFWVFRDGTHLTVRMSERLGVLFEPVLRGERAGTPDELPAAG